MLFETIFTTAATVVGTVTEETTTAITEIIQTPQNAGEAINNVVDNANKTIGALESYGQKLLGFGVNVLTAVLILLVGRFLINQIVKILHKILNRGSTDKTVKKFICSLIKVCLYIILMFIVLQVVGVQTASFVAVLGSAGVAIGLALQGTLSNVAGGVLILLVKPFKVGDYIIEEMNNGVEGVVSKIDIFYTSLTTIDNKIILIPNGTLINSRIVNVTKNDNRRIDFKVGISYQADIKQAKKILADVIDNIPDLVKSEDVNIFVKSLDASQVTVEARLWVPTDKYWNTLFKLNEDVKEEFDKQGISIPFNQMDVHIT